MRKTGRSIGGTGALARVPPWVSPASQGRRIIPKGDWNHRRFQSVVKESGGAWLAGLPSRKRTARTPLKGQEFVMAKHNRRTLGIFPEFDFLSAFLALFFGSRLELKPNPVRVR